MIIFSRDFTADPNLLPAPGRHPYYIVAPRYVETSAGLKALHVLCHCLNSIGQIAHLLIHPEWFGLTTNPELATPELTSAVAQHHFERRLTPIVVYPEVIVGDPFKAPVRVRYFGNFPGLLGGDKKIDEDEIRFGYSKVLATAVHAPENVLFIPVSDTRIFHPVNGLERSHVCYYAGKHRAVHNAKVFGLPKGSIEITRDAPDSLTRQQIADLFRRSKLFYCYENSALAIEATLCGCPTVFMPNEYFSTPIAREELGWDGFAWGNDPAEIERARQTVGNAFPNYVRQVENFWPQLVGFIRLTQEAAANTRYDKMIELPSQLRPMIKIAVKSPRKAFLVSTAFHILITQGFAMLVFRATRAVTRRMLARVSRVFRC
jgi:hypothetical protein